VLRAVKALELYKESIASNDALAAYYATIEQIEEVGGWVGEWDPSRVEGKDGLLWTGGGW
jgi:hypothetical protein